MGNGYQLLLIQVIREWKSEGRRVPEGLRNQEAILEASCRWEEMGREGQAEYNRRATESGQMFRKKRLSKTQKRIRARLGHKWEFCGSTMPGLRPSSSPTPVSSDAVRRSAAAYGQNFDPHQAHDEVHEDQKSEDEKNDQKVENNKIEDQKANLKPKRFGNGISTSSGFSEENFPLTESIAQPIGSLFENSSQVSVLELNELESAGSSGNESGLKNEKNQEPKSKRKSQRCHRLPKSAARTTFGPVFNPVFDAQNKIGGQTKICDQGMVAEIRWLEQNLSLVENSLQNLYLVKNSLQKLSLAKNSFQNFSLVGNSAAEPGTSNESQMLPIGRGRGFRRLH